MNEQGKHLRAAWEKGNITTLEFPLNKFMLFVIVEWQGGNYSLFRYFWTGNKWAVSSDCSGTFKDCATILSSKMRELA